MWQRFLLFRKKYFKIRFLLLMIVFIYVFYPSHHIINLVNIAIDSFFFSNISVVDFSRKYRKLEVLKIERKILKTFDKNGDKTLSKKEREYFTQETGLNFYLSGSIYHINASDREIVELGKKMGYEKRNYKEISRECFEKAKKEEKEIYSESIKKLKSVSNPFFSFLTLKKKQTWKKGVISLEKFLLRLFTGLKHFTFYDIKKERISSKWIWTWKNIRFSFYKPINLYKKILKDLGFILNELDRGIRIKKLKNEPGYCI